MIPYEDLARVNETFREEFIKQTQHVLEKGWFILGEEVSFFENEFRAFLLGGPVIGVASGLDALVLAIRALNLPPQSEVILPSNSYIATVLAVVHNGLQPVFVEPNPLTYNIEAKEIEKAITDKTKIILVIHLYGQACKMTEIMELANSKNIFVIEDCAQSHGALHKGKMTGTFGVFGCFSFYPTKNLGALGDGGAIVCNDLQYEPLLRMLRNYGSEKKYENKIIGFNSRLDELQAAFLRVKLRRLNQLNAHKLKLAKIYSEFLPEVLDPPRPTNDGDNVFHIFPVKFENREVTRSKLRDKGIMTEIHYPIPPYRQECILDLIKSGSIDCNIGNFGVTDEIHAKICSLPISFCHSEEDVYRVISALKEIL